MKNNEFLQNDVQNEMKGELKLSEAKPGIVAKAGKHIRTFIYIAGLAGIGLFMNSCMAGYVASEPSYVESVRPNRPNNLSVWIDGDWVYNRQSHIYVQNTGYWDRPSQYRTRISGQWRTGPHGKYWEKGRWENNRGQQRRNRR